MRRPTLAALALFSVWLGACATTGDSDQPLAPPNPPVAERHDHLIASPQGDRNDPYYWLRDDTRSDPEVLAYLNAENTYTQATLAPYESLRETLYREMVGRLKSADASPPSFHNGYWYYSRYVPGQNYAVLARRQGNMQAPEEILLDENRRAAGRDYYSLGNYSISPDNRLMAVAEDYIGRRQYELRVLDLGSGQWLDDHVADINPDLAWSDDSASVLYVSKDPVTLLGNRVMRHRLGSAADSLLYEEPDDSYYIELSRGKTEQYLYIILDSTEQTEVRYARADDPQLVFRPVLPREPGLRYQVDDHEGQFIILTNWQAPNYRLMSAPVDGSADKSAWRELVPGSDSVLLQSFEVFKSHFVLDEYRGGQRKLEVRDWQGGAPTLIEGSEPVYATLLVGSQEYDWPWLRYELDTLTHPDTTIDYNMRTGERRVVKVQAVEGDFDPDDYASEFRFATARDGARVPISLVYRKDLRTPGKNPLLIYGYGAYGLSEDPYFSRQLLSLLDRGFVYAIAHVRGGQEMGRFWYEQGRQANKMNTFSDFIDVTQFLTANGYGDPAKVFAQGGSAGGLLMGAIANLRPDLYRGIIAEVPFVDAVTSMLDESIPLTTGEFDEWGNPRYEPDYDNILAYSPYDNVRAQDYPAMLVTAGLWDSQVQYFEPAKWVARLRHRNTGDHWLLLRTNMDAGHDGQSGRYRRFEEVALGYTFMLAQLGIRNAGELAIR